MTRLLDHLVVPVALTTATIAVVGCLVVQVADALTDALWERVSN